MDRYGRRDGRCRRKSIPANVQIWDAISGKCLHSLAEKGTSPTWNKKGNLLAAIVDGEIVVWEMPSGTVRHRLAHKRGVIRNLDWHPEGDRIAGAGMKMVKPIRSREICSFGIPGRMIWHSIAPGRIGEYEESNGL